MATPMSQVQRTLDYLRDVKATKPGPMLSKAIEEVEKDLAKQQEELKVEGEPEHRAAPFNPLAD